MLGPSSGAATIASTTVQSFASPCASDSVECRRLQIPVETAWASVARWPARCTSIVRGPDGCLRAPFAYRWNQLYSLEKTFQVIAISEIEIRATIPASSSACGHAFPLWPTAQSRPRT